MTGRRRHFAWIGSALALLLIVCICTVPGNPGNRYDTLGRGASTLERIAKRLQIGWLEEFAGEQRRQCFRRSLNLRVERGDVAVVRIPAQKGLDSKAFFAELGGFSRSNNLHLAYMQANQTATGVTVAIYVQASERGAIVDYVERRKGLPITRSNE